MSEQVPAARAARVRLRPWRPEDSAIRAGWGGDPEIERYLSEQHERACWPCSLPQQTFAMLDEDGQVIGEVVLFDISRQQRRAELRVCIGRPDRLGRGYGREAVAEALRLAQRALRLQEVYVRVYRENRRAVRCYRRCGFVPTGRLRGREGGEGEVWLMTVRLPDVREEGVPEEATLGATWSAAPVRRAR